MIYPKGRFAPASMIIHITLLYHYKASPYASLSFRLDAICKLISFPAQSRPIHLGMLQSVRRLLREPQPMPVQKCLSSAVVCTGRVGQHHPHRGRITGIHRQRMGSSTDKIANAREVIHDGKKLIFTTTCNILDPTQCPTLISRKRERRLLTIFSN